MCIKIILRTFNIYYEMYSCCYQKCRLLCITMVKETHVQVIHKDCTKWKFCIIFKSVITDLELWSSYYIRLLIDNKNRDMKSYKIGFSLVMNKIEVDRRWIWVIDIVWDRLLQLRLLVEVKGASPNPLETNLQILVTATKEEGLVPNMMNRRKYSRL